MKRTKASCTTHTLFTYEPATPNQKLYSTLLQTHERDLVVLGPAGTGKTYGAVAEALAAIRARRLNKLVIARPAEGPCKSLGFEPGDMGDKLAGWAQPVTDLITQFIGKTEMEAMISSGKIEVIALHQVMGKTFDNAFVIVDEAQNLNLDTMLSIITRIGKYSKLVLAGDIRQMNIKRDSGLLYLLDLCDKHDMKFDVIEFGLEDVVRSEKVKTRIAALMDEGVY